MPHLRPALGQAATGDSFFDRPGEIRRIWEALESGSRVLIAAPRRVGKTSILLRLQDEEKAGFLCVYVITQAADSLSDFFKRLLRALVEDSRIQGRLSAFSTVTALKNLLGKLKGVTVAGTGIQFSVTSRRSNLRRD